MSFIYYSYYDPAGLSVPEITRTEHLLGRELLTKGLHDLYGFNVKAENADSLLCISENGKPYLKDRQDIFFNITHTGSLVACAFDSVPIGIDAEFSGYFDQILIKKILTESERSFLSGKNASEEQHTEWFWRFWTLKEAYVKLSGIGVDTDLKSFSFSFHEKENAPFGSDYCISCSDENVFCFQKKFSGGQILSFCRNLPPEEICLKEI